MSTVLEKPVLLDETGQAIVGKLDEIKDAIESGGTEKYPVLIHVTTMPTQTMFKAGEAIDYTGIVVKAVFSNNIEYDITSQCSFSPAQGTSFVVGEYPYVTTAVISYTWHPTGTTFQTSIALTWNKVDRIVVATPPTKTTYNEGDALNLAGLKVNKVYLDDSVQDITSDCTYTPADGAILATSNHEIVIRYFDAENPSGPTLQTYQSITVVPITIYGVEWDGTSSPAWTRTDGAENFTDPSPAVNNGNGSSPFDAVSPWKDIKKVNGGAVGMLVEIPKFYYKWTRTGAKMKLQITMAQQPGFLVSPAHADRGDGTGERDNVYVGRYHCSQNSKISTTGALPANNMTRDELRQAIHNLGNDIWQIDFAMWWTINMLILVEFANWNVQEKIGYGCSDAGTGVENSGATDSMTYHTGTNAAARTTYGHTQYRYIEDWWGNVRDWIDGIYFNDRAVYVINNPANFSDSAGGTNVGTRANTNGVVTEWTDPSSITDYEYALYPASAATDNNYETYDCDLSYYSASGVVLCAGGLYAQNQYSGAFYLVGSGAASSKYASIGSRLQKLP